MFAEKAASLESTSALAMSEVGQQCLLRGKIKEAQRYYKVSLCIPAEHGKWLSFKPLEELLSLYISIPFLLQTATKLDETSVIALSGIIACQIHDGQYEVNYKDC